MKHKIFLTAAFLAASALAAPAASPQLSVHHGKVYITVTTDLATQGFLQIDNATLLPDTLTGVKCPIAGSTQIVGKNNATMPSLAIAAGATASLNAGGPHLLLQSMHFPIDPGGAIPCSLTFQNAGEILVYLYAIPTP